MSMGKLREWWVRQDRYLACSIIGPFIVYCLSFLLFCLAYRIPGLALMAEESEDLFGAIFFPLRGLASVCEPLSWLANGFGGRHCRGTTIWWIYAFFATAGLICWSIVFFVRSVRKLSGALREDVEPPGKSGGWRRWIVWLAVFLVVPCIGFRIYVPLHIRHYTEEYVRLDSSEDPEAWYLKREAISAVAAYPEEAVDYVVGELDPSDTARCYKLQYLIIEVVVDWWETSDHDITLGPLVFARLELAYPEDPPPVFRRKVEGVKDWWARYRP